MLAAANAARNTAVCIRLIRRRRFAELSNHVLVYKIYISGSENTKKICVIWLESSFAHLEIGGLQEGRKEGRKYII